MAQSLGSVGPLPFDVDSVYLQKTLRHEPMELGLDDSVSLRALGIIMARAAIAWAAVTIVLGFIGVIVVAKSQNSGGGSSGGITLLGLAFVLGFITFLIVLLASGVTEPIGEWRALLADRAGQSESYYRVIAAVLKRRELPIALKARSIQLNMAGRPVKHTIVLSEGEYQTYVTVFPYGTSLYVGWQMWRRRSGSQLIRRALADRLTAVNVVTAMLRTDRARAMREAVHLACREALYTTADESLWAEAQQLRLPRVEQEAVLLAQQLASPVVPPPSAAPPPVSQAPPGTAAGGDIT